MNVGMLRQIEINSNDSFSSAESRYGHLRFDHYLCQTNGCRFYNAIHDARYKEEKLKN